MKRLQRGFTRFGTLGFCIICLSIALGFISGNIYAVLVLPDESYLPKDMVIGLLCFNTLGMVIATLGCYLLGEYVEKRRSQNRSKASLL